MLDVRAIMMTTITKSIARANFTPPPLVTQAHSHQLELHAKVSKRPLGEAIGAGIIWTHFYDVMPRGSDTGRVAAREVYRAMRLASRHQKLAKPNGGS